MSMTFESSSLPNTTANSLTATSVCERIRLFHISLVDDVIECKLRNATNKVEYTAVSYVCGHSRPKNEIKVNGAVFYVKDNLFKLLHGLCQRGITRNLWIDAICINQNNFAERNQQVTRMSDTFWNASQAIYWLGMDTPEVDTFAAYLISGFKGRKEDNSFTAAFEELRRRDNPTKGQILTGLRQLLLCEYWKRAWCVQEVILTQGKGSIIIGSKSVCWADFMNFCEGLEQVKYWAHSKLPTFTADLINRGAGQFIAGVRSYNSSPGGFTLAMVLRHFGKTGCADPRDRIFALRMILKDPLVVRVDYYTSTADLYCEIATQYIQPLIAREEQWIEQKVKPPPGLDWAERKPFSILRRLAEALGVTLEQVSGCDKWSTVDMPLQQHISSTFGVLERYPGG